jgi:hypothetical protein
VEKTKLTKAPATPKEELNFVRAATIVGIIPPELKIVLKASIASLVLVINC